MHIKICTSLLLLSLIIALLLFSCISNSEEYASLSTHVTTHNTQQLQNDFYKSQNVTTSYDNKYVYIYSQGLPRFFDTGIMKNITYWDQSVPLPQTYEQKNSWKIPIKIKVKKDSLSLKDNLWDSPIAIAIDGVPIYNPIGKDGDVATKPGHLDALGGHAGPHGDYHYHKAPLHLEKISQNGPIAYALDGFPIYGLQEQDGTVATNLDRNHGHPDNSSIGYHYHSSTHYPYTIGRMVGHVSLDSRTSSPFNKIAHVPQVRIIRSPQEVITHARVEQLKKINDTTYQLSYKITTDKPDKNGYYNFYDVQYSWNQEKMVYTFQYFINGYIQKAQTYILLEDATKKIREIK